MANGETVVNKIFTSDNIKYSGYVLMVIGIIFLIKGFLSNRNVGATSEVGDKIEALNNTNYATGGFILFGIGILIVSVIKQ